MKYFVVVLMLLLSSIGWSQSLKFLFRGQVENFDLAKNEGGVKIAIVQGGATIASATSSSNGKYTLKGDVNYSQPFDVVFSKAGFVSKKVAFDFSTLNEEDTPASAEFQPIEFLDMTIFKERENVDFSFLDSEPVAKFEWNERKVQARLDGTLVSRMKSKIEALLTEAENEAAQLEADYLAAVKAGDDAFAKKEYESALSSFEEALGYKPNEKYPAEKIIELDALIEAQKTEELAEKQENQEYYNLIEAADNLKEEGNLEKASSTYKEASAKRPSEQYPKDQIAAIQKLLDEKNQALADEEAYNAAIKSGDVFFKQNSLRPAKEKYEAASKLKPEEAYPKEKLKQIEDKMAELEEREALKKKYTDAINAGDKAYDAEDFQAAKDKYEEALTFESSSTYAKGRIEMCDEALASSKAEEERLAKIQELLEKGNADLAGEKYEDAVASFSEVLTLDDENAEATTKLAEAQLKLEELASQAESEKQYTALIEEGDQANTAKKLEDALAKYEAAKVIKETPEVNEKIAGVQDAINLAKLEADKEANYNALITDAEAKFGADDLQGAIDKYTEALALDPSKPEPTAKIAEIQKIIDERAANQAKNEEFAGLMKEGSDLMAADELENAKLKFQEASTIDPTSPEPQAKIDEIDALIAQNEANQEMAEQFAALMKEGSDLMAADDLENAKSKFEEAKSIDPSKAEPQIKIDEIDALIAENESQQQKQEQFIALMKEGNDLMASDDLTNAKSKFEEAAVLDPTSTEPQTKIDEINALIAKNASEQEKAEQFAALMKEGNDLMASDDLNKAKSKFQEASALEPSETEPKEKIEEINALIAEKTANQENAAALQTVIDEADKLFGESEWENSQAKYNEALALDPTNEYAKGRLGEIDLKIAEEENRAQVDALLADANALRVNNELENARSKYQEVLAIDPSNTAATAKIDEINSELAALQNAEQKEQAFADLKAEGTELFNENKLPEAKQKFTEALSFKSDAEVEATIAEIDKLIAASQAEANQEEQYAQFIEQAESSEGNEDYAAAISAYKSASGIKPTETLPKEKIKELTDKLAEKQASNALEVKYANLISEAEAFEGDQNYTAAISSYEKASAVKPEQTLPKSKIAELKALMEANAANQAVIDQQYAEAMDRGEKLMSSEDYLDAITAFNEALALKPTEQEPKDRAAAAEEAERQKGDGDAQYEKILTVAEAKIESGDYNKAEELIDRAKMFKPEDKRPDELLAQVNKLRARDKQFAEFMAAGELEANGKNYKNAIAQFEKAKALKPTELIPQDRIDEMNRLLTEASSVNQKETLYKNYMDKGQAAMTGTKFVEALGHYQNALSVKEGDQQAQDKVNEIQQILDDLANEKAENLENKLKFDAFMKEGNKLFSQGEYLNAKENFDSALGVDPYSSLAKERSDECAKLAANIGKQEAEAQYQKLLKSADKSFDAQDWAKAKDYYGRAINMRSSDPYPKKKLEEIEAIQNPAIAESIQLQPLGEKFDGSLLDGGFILEASEESRKLQKGTRIQEELGKANASQTELTSQNQTDRLGTQTELSSIWEDVSVSTEGANDSREATIKKLRNADQIREDAGIRDAAYEKGDNLNAQGQLNAATDEFVLNYMQGDDRRQESVEVMKGVQTAEENETYRQGKAYIQRKYEADEAMNQVAIKVEAEVKNDYEERLEIERRVDAASDETAEVYKSIGESKYDNVQHEQAGIQLVKSKVSSKSVEDAEKSGQNNESVKDIRSDVNTVALAYMQQDDRHGKEVDAEMAEVRRKTISDNEGFDKVRKEANEHLKNIQSEQATLEELENAGQSDKYLANKQVLTEEERRRKDVTDKADVAMSEKVAYVNAKDKAARANSSEARLSDEEERLSAKQKIVNQEIAQSNKSTEDVKSHVENTENLKDVKSAGNAKTEVEGMVQREKNLTAQQDLDKINNDPKKKVVIANSLGQEYPEGVSQEAFTIKDEAGLVTTVNTRRIVVIDGHADVYVRTQTKHGITYSKNNKPSLQHVWNSETQGPNLERHY